MQAGKNAAASVKESAANVAASAKAGMEKTKATVQEKTERMTTHDPVQKDMATQKKEERMNQAEINKQEAREQNAAAKQAAATGGTQSYTGTGATGHHPTGGAHPMSTMPGFGAGTGHSTGQVTEGGVESHPLGTATGTGRSATARNAGLGGTGGTYSA